MLISTMSCGVKVFQGLSSGLWRREPKLTRLKFSDIRHTELGYINELLEKSASPGMGSSQVGSQSRISWRPSVYIVSTKMLRGQLSSAGLSLLHRSEVDDAAFSAVALSNSTVRMCCPRVQHSSERGAALAKNAIHPSRRTTVSWVN